MDAQACFPPELESAAAARRFAEAALDEWGLASVRDAARLLVSELVVNSVLHAGTAVTLSLGVEGSRLRVEVGDGSTVVPVLRDQPPAAPTGRGMMIVEDLADRWGVDADDQGKTVWFELVEGSGPPATFDRGTTGAIVEGTS